MRPTKTWLGTLATAALVASGCNATTDQAIDEEEDSAIEQGKAEAWNNANNPAFVDNSFVYEVDELPVKGEARPIPWSGDYWAVDHDSINYRWDGENSLSPAEKVEKAFHKTGFAQDITDTAGIYGKGQKACDDSSECESLKDGSSCVKPRGATGSNAGRCVPSWWGICHGWAPAALSEAAPVKSVLKGGVTFYPGDLEGLMSFVYSENLSSMYLSERCNKEGDKLGTDNSGRVREGECRDMNPGSMHVVVTNFLGKRRTSIVEDRTYDIEIWNQPVRGYEITNAVNDKLQEITKQEAIDKVGLNGTTYTYNVNAERFYYVEMDLFYIRESKPARRSHMGEIDDYTSTDSYSYVLETDDKGRILGGEWVGDSMTRHPDFMWWPDGKPYGDVNGLSYDDVKELFDNATEEAGVETRELLSNATVGTSSTYVSFGVEGRKRVTLKMTGTGNANLYVRLGSRPTFTNFLAKSTGPTSNETVSFTSPASGGTYYLRAVRVGSSSSKVSVTATIESL